MHTHTHTYKCTYTIHTQPSLIEGRGPLICRSSNEEKQFCTNNTARAANNYCSARMDCTSDCRCFDGLMMRMDNTPEFNINEIEGQSESMFCRSSWPIDLDRFLSVMSVSLSVSLSISQTVFLSLPVSLFVSLCLSLRLSLSPFHRTCRDSLKEAIKTLPTAQPSITSKKSWMKSNTCTVLVVEKTPVTTFPPKEASAKLLAKLRPCF